MRNSRTLKFVLCIPLYFALAMLALTASRPGPGDDDDDLTSGETFSIRRPPAPRPSATPIQKTVAVESDASRAVKANANVPTGAGSSANGNNQKANPVAKVSPAEVKIKKSTVSVKAQDKLPAKTSQTVQEIKVNETKPKKSSSDSGTNSGDERKQKKEKSP